MNHFQGLLPAIVRHIYIEMKEAISSGWNPKNLIETKTFWHVKKADLSYCCLWSLCNLNQSQTCNYNKSQICSHKNRMT